jgi:hypothetical protein
MQKLGYEDQVIGQIESLEKLEFEEPLYYPCMPDGRVVFCIVKFRGVDKKVVYICRMHREMNLVYHTAKKSAEEIIWYSGFWRPTK